MYCFQSFYLPTPVLSESGLKGSASAVSAMHYSTAPLRLFMHIIAEHGSNVNRGKTQKRLKNDMRNHAVLDVLQSDLFLHTAREPYYEDPGDAEEHYLPHSVASENERDKKKY